jgi:hypothetical protein
MPIIQLGLLRKPQYPRNSTGRGGAGGPPPPRRPPHAGTSEFTAAVVERVATKLDVWSSLGS